MTEVDRLTAKEEFALQTLFGRDCPPVADAGFSKMVRQRLHRQIWQRRLILISAITFGLVIALPAVGQALAALSAALLGLADHAEKSDAVNGVQILLSMFPVRDFMLNASEDIKTFSSQISSGTWLVQNRILIMAALLALVSIITTQSIDD